MMCCVYLLLVAAMFCSVMCSSDVRKPLHVVVVIVDDIGVADLGFSVRWAEELARTHNATYALSGRKSPISTPHIDSLVEEGVHLTSYYSHPMCTPARAALMTGRYAHNLGLNFALVQKAIPGLPQDVSTLPQELKQRGYHTHHIGKWHIGHSTPWMIPTSRGFDTFFGVHGWGFDHYLKERDGCIDLWNGTVQFRPEEIDHKDHATNMFSREAIRVIKQHAANNPTEPMFLYLSYTAAHAPLEADEYYIEKCKNVEHKTRRLFCAMIAQLDDGLANVTNALKEAEMWENTLLVFTSDNGGLPLVGGLNYPFSGSKSTSFEGGSRVPAFVRPPARLNWKSKGVEYDGLMHISDWMPTLLSIIDSQESRKTEVKASELPKNLDGVDMSEALSQGAPSPRATVIPQEDIILNATAYRNGCWKLLLGSSGPLLLFREPGYYLLDVYRPDAPKSMEFIFNALEWLYAVIDFIIPPPGNQFPKYAINVQLTRLDDWLSNSGRSHLNTKNQRYDLLNARLHDHLPSVEWGKVGRVQLFNVCKDPSEQIDLARSMPEVVSRLHSELIDELKHYGDKSHPYYNPIQWATDDTFTDAPDGAECSPWLDANVDLNSLYTDPSKHYNNFAADATRLTYILAAISAVLVVFLFTCCWCVCSRCCKRNKGKQHKE